MKRINVQSLTLTALLAALTIALSAAESFLLPPLPAGVRLGLANVGVMIALVFAGGRSALTVTVLKSAFVLLTRGVIAGVMSGVGSILALTALVFLLRPGGKNSLIFSAAVAAVCHAVGQLAMSAIITGSVYVIIYAPLPIVAAIVAGVCTGIVTESIIKLNIYNSEIINGNKKLGRQQTRSQ